MQETINEKLIAIVSTSVIQIDGNSFDLIRNPSDFNNELITYAVYKAKTAENQVIRDTIVQRALSTNLPGDEQDYLDDPESIAVPWEEKYGKEPDSNVVITGNP